jgi:hypothetical protein
MPLSITKSTTGVPSPKSNVPLADADAATMKVVGWSTVAVVDPDSATPRPDNGGTSGGGGWVGGVGCVLDVGG